MFPSASQLVSLLRLIALAILAGSLTLPLPASATAQDPEVEAIHDALNRYLQGTSTNDGPLTASAFYEDARLFLSHPEREIWIVPILDYASRLPANERGEPNGRTGQVLSVERHGDIATATAEVRIPGVEGRFIDLFLLKKLSGDWKILSKAATRLDEE